MLHNEDIEREGWSFLTGVMVGTALGVTAALLLAPKRGSELRTDLASAAAGVRDTVSDKVSTLKKTADDLADRGRTMAADASRSIQHTAQVVADTGSAIYDATRRGGARASSGTSAD